MNNNIFNTSQSQRPMTSTFDLGHEVKMSMDMGKLIPFYVQETVPGDTFRMKSDVFMRLAPMLAPIMHRVNVYTHFWKVPMRLLWEEFPEFITGGEDGNSNPVMPYIDITECDISALGKGSLLNYLGFPAVDPNSGVEQYNINAMIPRAYQLIYNEWYRDENLIDKVPIEKTGGKVGESELAPLLSIRKRCWEKDYYTSCLPEPQKGPDVLIPMEGQANVILNDTGGAQGVNLYDLSNNVIIPDGQTFRAAETGGKSNLQSTTGGTNNHWVSIDPNGTLIADLATATATSINDLRDSFAIQRLFELLMRGGSRYTEVIMSVFGVKSSDSRLQRPEYLGGGQSPVILSEVLQQSATQEDSPQGNMAGHGISVGTSHSFSTFCEEHCYIIGIISVMPKTSYQQGVPKHFRKFDRFDFYWPSFAHLGEEAVTMDELYFDASLPEPDNTITFGYQSKYAHMRYTPSRVAGDFTDNLSYWHLGRILNGVPALNQQFVECDASKRIFAVTDENTHSLWVEIYNDVLARRPMPYEATPGMIDHY